MRLVIPCLLTTLLQIASSSGYILSTSDENRGDSQDFWNFLEDIYDESRDEKKSYHALESAQIRNDQGGHEENLQYAPVSDADQHALEDLLDYLSAGSEDQENYFPSLSQEFRRKPDEGEYPWNDLTASDILDRKEDRQRLLTTALLEDILDNAEEEAKQNKWKEEYAEETHGEDNKPEQADRGESDISIYEANAPTSDGKKLREHARNIKEDEITDNEKQDTAKRSFISEKLNAAGAGTSVMQSDVDELRSLLTQLADSEAAKESGLYEDSSKKPKLAVDEEITIDVTFPGVSVTQNDTYLCTAVNIDDYANLTNESVYITKYTPHAKQTVAHHMLLYGCLTPGVKTAGAVWNCGGLMVGGKENVDSFPPGRICGDGERQILWAWAKNAPTFQLPKDVGFKVGHGTNVRYLVLQVHYKSANVFKGGMKDHSAVTIAATNKRKSRLAGVYILASAMETIMPHRIRNFDIECRYIEPFPIHPFAFRTHTHALGLEVMGFRVRDSKWTLIGAKDPQLPEAFYPVATKNMTIDYNDILAARCVMYNFRKVPTSIGSRHTDEMCNFYIMFWVDSKYEKEMNSWIKSCSNGFPWVHWSDLPGYYG